MDQTPARRHRGLLTLLLLLAAIVLVLSQAQRIQDWVKLRNYQPTTEIAAIVDETTMTPAAVHLFYTNHPVLEDKEPFRGHCPRYEQTIVIGCYLSGQRGIFLRRITEPRLEGVEQVTAAHEMLHAAYERLGRKERQQVDGWLQDYAANKLSDPRIKETLKGYETTEPGEQGNEMHSIFGTEIADLPDELQQYYGRYFRDRQAVVSLAVRYQEAFTSRQKQVAEYDTQLNAINKKIEANTKAMDGQRASIEREERQLLAYERQRDIQRYNAGVPAYNQRVNAYNALIEQTRLLIEEYNRIVEVRNATAAETVELRQALDSTALPENQ